MQPKITRFTKGVRQRLRDLQKVSQRLRDLQKVFIEFAHIRSGFMEVFKEWFSMEWL